jgi:hypothetical protein
MIINRYVLCHLSGKSCFGPLAFQRADFIIASIYIYFQNDSQDKVMLENQTRVYAT